MKNTILFFALFLSFAAFAQFPASKPELLIGHEVKVRPLLDYELEIDNGYANFYTNSEMTMSYVYMPGEDKIRTKIDALEGHILKVVNVEVTSTGYNKANYRFTLQDNDNVIYYSYRKNSKTYLEPVNFTLPDDYYCSYIARNESSLSVSYSTSESTNYFELHKYIDKGRGTTYNLTTYVQMTGGTSTGIVTLVLNNGKKLSFPNSRFSFHAGKAYASTISLSNADLQALTENKINEVYFNSNKMDFTPYADDLKGILKCLITKK